MPNINEELRSVLGFAMKAGKVASGDFAVDKAVKSYRAKLVVVDSMASDNTKKRWQDACSAREIPIVSILNMGDAIGKGARMVAAVTDGGFAAMMLKKVRNAGE